MRTVKTIFLFLYLSMMEASFAQIIEAGEVYYDQLSDKKYLVTAMVYRQCNGLPLNNLPASVISGSHQLSMNMIRQSIQRINDTCNNPCQNINSASNEGYEKHTFSALVDFNVAPYNVITNTGNCEVKFAIHGKFRPGNYTNLKSNDSLFYVDAMTNICFNLSSDHSPRFSIEPKINCYKNIGVMYSPGPMDTFDYDSLSFHLVPLQINDSQNVDYLSPYSFKVPVTVNCSPLSGNINCRALPDAKPPRGMYFDSFRCQLIFTDVKIEHSGFKFMIKQYRRNSIGEMILLGYVCRDMNVHVWDGGYDNNSYFVGSTRFTTCDAPICFTVDTRDDPYAPQQTIADTVSIDWDKGIKGAEFKINDPLDREKSAQFCWKNMDAYKTGTYYFTVKSWDKNCNASLSSSTNLIRFWKNLEYTTQSNIDSCNLLRLKVIPLEKGIEIKGMIEIRNSRNEIVYTTVKSIDSTVLYEDGVHYVYYNFTEAGATCFTLKLDSIIASKTINQPFRFNQTDTMVCPGFDLKLNFNPSHYPKAVTWTWYKNDTLLKLKDSVLIDKVFWSSHYKLVLKDQRLCSYYGLRNVNAHLLDDDVIADDTVGFCRDALVKIKVATKYMKGPISYRWTYKNIDTTVVSPVFTFRPKENLKLNLSIIDSRKCEVKDQVVVDSGKAIFFNLMANKEKYCYDSVITIKTTKGDDPLVVNTNWRIDERDTGLKYMFELALKVRSQHLIELELKDSNGCRSSSKLVLNPIKNPEFELQGIDRICKGNMLYLKARLLEVDTDFNVSWFKDQMKLNHNGLNLFNAVQKNSAYKLRIGNRSTCYTEKTKLVNLYPASKLEIVSNSYWYNAYDFVYLEAKEYYKFYEWSTGDTGRKIEFPAHNLGTPGIHSIWCKTFDSNYCDVFDTLEIRTDFNTSINKMIDEKPIVYPNPFVHKLYIHSTLDQVFELVDVHGIVRLKGALQAGENTFDWTDLPSGVYALRYNDTVLKLVKE